MKGNTRDTEICGINVVRNGDRESSIVLNSFFFLYLYSKVSYRPIHMGTFQSRYIVSHKKPFSVEYGVSLKVFASFSIGSVQLFAT